MTRQVATGGLATHKTGPDSSSVAGLPGTIGKPVHLPMTMRELSKLESDYADKLKGRTPLSIDPDLNQRYMEWWIRRGWRQGERMPRKPSVR